MVARGWGETEDRGAVRTDWRRVSSGGGEHILKSITVMAVQL